MADKPLLPMINDDTLLDRGNLSHSNMLYIHTLLFAEIFVSTVIWDFCAALLAPCTSKSVCLPFLQLVLFGFGICTMCHLQLLHFISFQ